MQDLVGQQKHIQWCGVAQGDDFNPYNAEIHLFNHLSPHDALKHHFTSVKADFIRVSEQKFT